MKIVVVTAFTNFLEASRLRKTVPMTQMFFVYNSRSDHSIFNLIFDIESKGLSLSPVRKASKSDKNCGRVGFYKLSRSLPFAKNCPDDANVFCL